MTEYEAHLSLSPTARVAVWGKESSSGPCDLRQSLDELSLSGTEPPHPPAANQSLLQGLSDLHAKPFIYSLALCAASHGNI